MAEENGKTVWYPCKWCPNIFLTEKDLLKHYEAAKTTGVKPNEYDHKVWWKNQLIKRDHEFLDDW